MDMLLVITLIGGVVLVILLLRPTTPLQVIYVPVEVVPPRQDCGCLPLVLVAAAVLAVLWALA
jgi:hypothetical protein